MSNERKRQRMIYKTQDRKLMIKKHEFEDTQMSNEWPKDKDK
jgi:hypothetical protein